MNLSKEQVMEVFNAFDKDQSGTIEKNEIADLAHNVGIELTPQKIQKIMNVIDTNGDGKISFDEFYEYFQYGMQKQMDKIINAKFKHIKEVKKLQKKLSTDYNHIFEKNNQEGKSLSLVQVNVGQFDHAKTGLDISVRVGQENKHFAESIQKNFPYLDDNIITFVVGIKCNNSDKVEEAMKVFLENTIDIIIQMLPEEVQASVVPFREDLKIEYKALPDELLVRFYLQNDLVESTLQTYRSVSGMFLNENSSLLIHLSVQFLQGLSDIAANANVNLFNWIGKAFKAELKIENTHDLNEIYRQFHYNEIGKFFDQNNNKIKMLEALTPLVLLQNARLQFNFNNYEDFLKDMGIPELELATLEVASQQAKQNDLQGLILQVPPVAEFLDIMKTEGQGQLFLAVIASEASVAVQITGEGASQIWEKLL